MQKNLDPSELPDDLETLTDEERFLFRKMGLSMKPFLVLGKTNHYDTENNGSHGQHSNISVMFSQVGEEFMMVL